MFRAVKKNIARHADLWIVFVIGVLLRFEYTMTTLLNLRSYDWPGHLEYIDFMYRNFSTPSWGGGWETHQPPLYYALIAVWMRVFRFLGITVSIHSFQIISMLLSFAAIAACVVIAQILFTGKQKFGGIFFLGIVATLPGIVFVAARISNDALLTSAVFVFTSTLLLWWKSKKNSSWSASVALATIAVLSKFNGLFCVATLFVCLALHPAIPKKRKIRLATAAILFMTLCGSWLIAMRIQDGFMAHLALPGSGAGPELMLPTGPLEMLSFSPVRIVMTTYNDAISDVFGRAYFWEFLFKSAFFGAWAVPGHMRAFHQLMLVTGLGTLALSVAGIIHAVRKKSIWNVPLLATLFMGFLFLWILRVWHGSSANQDFRFIPQVMIPIAVYATWGMESLRGRWKTVAVCILAAFPVLCGVFILSLPFVWR